ncbi:MAG: 4-hydroxybutyrate dehydrogenase [Planctomycetaceae bacterium]|nr:4-hydroxybutyrate dehydrogenase [Planctomycetaceae bacterium]
MSSSLISYLTDVHFGCGAIAELPALLSSLNISRPLLVTDKGLSALGMPDRLQVDLAAVHDDVPTNPTESSVVAGANTYSANSCDGIIALGGGSPIDCAKGVSLKVTHPGPLKDYALIHGGLAKITADKPPLIAIPTTAGTGTEVGRGALITVEGGTKLGIISKHIIPTASICDPELTVGLPPRLTAATGVDAISHCVETYSSPKFNPVADAIALDGLSRAWQHLPIAVSQPENLEARSEMMLAAMQGALAFQKGLGLIHSLSHPMGALPHRSLHHGELNGVFMPHVLRFNAQSCPDKMAGIANAVGAASSEDLPQFFTEFQQVIALPISLSEMGVEPVDLETIPPLAIADHSTPSNPRKAIESDCREILQAAL